MKVLKEMQYSIEQQIAEEEFRYWDACRNGCSTASLQAIKQKIESLEAYSMVLPTLSSQNVFAMHTPQHYRRKLQNF